MPLNDKKIISVLSDQCAEQIEERCDGYKQEVAKVVCDILEIVQDYHAYGYGTDAEIQEEVDKTCNKLTLMLIDENVDVASAAEHAAKG